MILKIFRPAGAPIALLIALSACAGTIRDTVYAARSTPVAIAAFTQHAPQAIAVRSADGTPLTGYYWAGDPVDRDVLLFFHGRGSHQGIGARRAERLTGTGDHVIVVSYRGFGGNPGRPTQAGLVADGRAFVQEAHRLVGPDARVFLIGHSLGGAVALHVAATVPVAGVVTLSTFDTLSGSAPPGVGALLPDKWNNLDAVTKIHAPFVMMQGTADDQVTVKQAQALFAAARAPAVWITEPGEGHSPDMARIGPLVSAAVAAIDAGDLARYPTTLPARWSATHK